MNNYEPGTTCMYEVVWTAALWWRGSKIVSSRPGTVYRTVGTVQCSCGGKVWTGTRCRADVGEEAGKRATKQRTGTSRKTRASLSVCTHACAPLLRPTEASIGRRAKRAPGAPAIVMYALHRRQQRKPYIWQADRYKAFKVIRIKTHLLGLRRTDCHTRRHAVQVTIVDLTSLLVRKKIFVEWIVNRVSMIFCSLAGEPVQATFELISELISYEYPKRA